MSVDIQDGPDALVQAWRHFGSHACVIAGSGAALLSLFQGVPLHVASLRGAMAFAAVYVFVRIGAVIAEKTWTSDVDESAQELADETNDADAPSSGRQRAA